MSLKSIAVVTLFGFCNYCFAFDAPQYDRNAMKTDDTRIVGMECHKKNHTLEVGYFTAYNIPSKRMDLWNTFDLKKNSADGKTVESVYVVVRKCSIGNDHYVVKFRPVPGNMSLNGECGGDTSGGATIFKNGVLVFDANFEGCRSEEVIVRVNFSSDSEKPVITKISNNEFVFGKPEPK